MQAQAQHTETTENTNNIELSESSYYAFLMVRHYHVQVIVQVVIQVLVIQVVVIIRRKDNHPDSQYSIQSDIVTVTTYALIDNTIQRINQFRISNTKQYSIRYSLNTLQSIQ